MSKELTELIFEAARQGDARGIALTTKSTQEIRDAITAEVRMRSIFVARAANLDFLTKVKEVTTAVADGRMNQATARLTLLETLKAVGYTPEGGFPDVPAGQIPPAIRGSLEDLSSRRRLDLIIDTQRDLMRGLATKAKGMAPAALSNFPAFELIRIYDRREKRDWRARWEIAGGKLISGRMIAFKGDPVWGELGSSGNFEDALDVDFPPFAFTSGIGWQPISRADCRRLGVVGPDGESVDEWQAQDRPVLGGLQEPVVSVRKADPEILRKFEEETGAAVIEGQATPAAGKEELLARLAARRAAREARAEERMRRALAR